MKSGDLRIMRRILFCLLVVSISGGLLYGQQSCPSSLSVVADPITGIATGTMTIAGQCSNASYTWQVPGAGIGGGGTCSTVGACTNTFTFGAWCLADGSHTVTYNTTCGFNDGQGGCSTASGSGSASFATEEKPRISLTLTRTGPAYYHGVVTFEFPGTNSWNQRSIVVTGTKPDGTTETFWGSNYQNQIGEESGTREFDIQADCHPNGTTTVKATATACNGDTAEDNQSFTINHKPQVDMNIVRNADLTYTATINYNFPDNNGADREIILRLLPTTTQAGGTIADWNQHFGAIPNPQGTQVVNFNMDGRRILRVTAIACGSDEVEKDEGIDCANCGNPGSTGDPVQLIDGTMTYVENDPLPDELGLVFRRVYKSTDGMAGRFGTGWLSAFDAGVITDDTPNHHVVAVYTENDSHAAFEQQTDGSWLQVWPTGRSERGTLTGSDSSGYSYREPHSSVVRLYGGAGNHHLTGFLNLRTGHSVLIDYDANWMPTRVRDDATRWSCTVTTDPTKHFVTQIAVYGRPDLVWNYSYGGEWSMFLVSVGLAGASAPWRTYEYDMYSSMPDYFYLSRVRDSLGNILEQHTYDNAGHALSSLGPSGDFTNVQYNFNGTPVSTTTVTKANGSTTTYQQSFQGDHDATIHVDGGCASCGGHDLTYAFDSFGHVIRKQDGRGYIILSTYDDPGTHLISTTSAMTPAGCDPAAGANCLLSSQDLAAAALSPTAASHTASYTYADPNWPEKATTTQRGSAMTPGQFVTETLMYDATTGDVLIDNVTGATGSDAHQETHTTTTTLYDGTEGAPFNPGGAFQSSWQSIPQPRGLRKIVDGPRTDVSDVTTYVYYPFDPSVPATWRGRLAGVRNAMGSISRLEDYDVFGHAATLTDPNGVITRFTFDPLGRIVTTTVSGAPSCDTGADPLCATDITATNAYSNTTGPLTLTQKPNGNVTLYAYDSRGRVTTVSRGPSSTDLREQMMYTYDASTQKKASERYLLNNGGTWTEEKSESYAYDSLGRLSLVTHADGTSIRYAYDAADDLISVQDERHASPNTSYAYDPAKRITTVMQTLATAPGGQALTAYTYDALDNLTGVTDPNGNTTAYLFDDFARMLRQTSPVTGNTTYSYDLAGNLTSTNDANGATTNRVYDALSRPSSASSSRGGSVETVTWTYDGTAPFGVGRLATLTDPTGSTAYTYDRRGLLLSEIKTINGIPYATRYQYDAAGNRSRIVYPSGRLVDFTFDFAERPYAVTSSGTTLVSSATYAPFGPLTSMTLGNGTTKTVTVDNRYRVLENKLTGPAGILADYQYTPDAASNITQIHDMVDPTFNRDFGYDDVNRLITANSGRSLWGAGAFSYDAMGNMLTLAMGGERTSTFSYVGTTPQLSAATENGIPAAVAYDSAGNEINVAGKSFTYSPRNELIDAQDVSYQYDGRGVRTITTIPAGAVNISSLTLAPSTVFGGDQSTASLALSAAAPAPGVTVSLSSDNELIATVPATVTVPAGSASASFNISSLTQYTVQNVAIRARVVGSSAAATLTVEFHPYVTSLTFDRSLIDGGTTAVGTVTVAEVAPPNGTVVTLVSSNPSAASVPASITIPTGAMSATFTLTSYSVTADTPVTITATAVTSISTTVTIRATPMAVSQLTASPVNVVGGHMTSTGTISLNQPSLPGGIVVALASSDTSTATVPATVTVPEGSLSATFSITTSSVGAATPVTISATYATTVSATITVNPCSNWSPDAAMLGSGERVWIEDAIPTGGQPYGTWTWDTNQKVSGTQSSTIGPGSGVQQYYFVNATNTMPIDTPTEAIVVYALLDPCNPPQEILFQFNAGGSWEHRAYWGTNVFSYGTDGTNSRRRLGDLPPLGQWVRLVVPISRVGLGGMTVNGMAFDVVDGRAWFDRVSRVSCLTNVPPPSSFPSGEVVWVEDAIPSGASTSGVWIWDTAQKASGTASNTDVVIDTDHQHYFVNATATITVGVGDTLFAYALISPCDPPDEIVLQWNDGNWEHRGYWGANLFSYGVDGTNSRRRMGGLPAAGQWVRLEIPASQIGLEGHTLSGLSFDTMGGKVWYDHVGVKRAGSGVLTPPPAQSSLWAALRRIFRRPASEPPISLSMTASSIAVQDVTPKQRYSLYSPELSLMAETATGSTTNLPIAYEYVWFGGAPLAQIETATGAMHWYFNDHLGAPILTTSASGSVDWRVEREPYGKTFVRIGGDRHQPLGFPGQESDDDSNDREYNIFRWYRSSWGRYTQADPLGLRGGSNLFRYAGSRPVISKDRLGLVEWHCRIGFFLAETIGGGPETGGIIANCVSDCVNHRVVTAIGASTVGGASVASPLPAAVSYSSSVTLHDNTSTPNADSLNGVYGAFSVGAGIGRFNGGCTLYVIGSASGLNCSPNDFAIGGGVSTFAGGGGVIDRDWSCCD